MPVQFAAFVEYCLIAVAPTLLVWEWIRRVARKQYPVTLILSTISCLWLLTGLVWREAIGPNYSNLHAYIALTNSVADLLCTLVAAGVRTQRSLRTILASLILSLIWAVTFSIMYAV